MQTLLRIFASIILISGVTILNAQVQEVCQGEPIIFEIQQGFWGTPYLDYSENGETWEEMGELSNEPYIAESGNNGFYRVRIYDADCDSSYFSNVVDVEIVDCGTVYSPATGRIWMDRNLGASQVATSATDEAAYGDLYQWGRGADGHQIRTSPTTSILSSSDQPGHGSFILASNSPYDWRSPQNTALWQGVNGINNPCPAGFRLPTEAEWHEERLSWGSTNTAGAFGSPLKLTAAGYRHLNGGALYNVGSNGYYWSSTVAGINARHLNFGSGNANVFSSSRAFGNSVRCIKD